jgi:large repetitive protein
MIKETTPMQTIVSIHPRSNRLRILVLVALVALLMPWIGSQPAHAAGKTFSVNSTLDEPDAVPGDGNCVSVPAGVCTLRAAIMEANLWLGDDIIILQPNKTYLLTRAGGGDDSANLGDLDIVQNLTINVAGGGSAVVDGNGDVTYDRVFQIFSNISVTISGLTIKNGKPARDGGGIYNIGTLTLNKSTVSGNTANYSNGGPLLSGGGIYNIGTLGLTNSTVSSNTTNGGWGGGIYNAGTMTLTNSTISGNHASGFGGGIYVVGGAVQLYNATIAYNRADSDSSGNGDGAASSTRTAARSASRTR